jgi:hypothetical protein|nr:MAG TPA: hypothetical protein [Caudoviricetes sp.]
MGKNPYENLRVDNRARLPQPWKNYPVLHPGEFKTEIVYVNGREHAKIHIGQQDGVRTVGYDFYVGNHGGGCYPGRKWGDFVTEQDAKLWALGFLLTLDTEDDPLPAAMKKAINTRIFEIRQYKLF